MCPQTPNSDHHSATKATGQSRVERSQAVLLIDHAPAAPLGRTIPDERLETVSRERSAAIERSMPKGWRVFHAIHHGSPSIAEALDEVHLAGVDRLVVIPMRPQFSESVTGDELHELYRLLGQGPVDVHVDVRSWWHDDAAYVDAQARLVHRAAIERGLSPSNALLVFWADSGSDHNATGITQTAELVRRRLGWPEERCSTLITGSDADDKNRADALLRCIESTGADDGTPVLVCAIAHTTDGRHLRSELELVVSPAQQNGVWPIHVCPSHDDSEDFVKALTLLVRRGRQPAGETRQDAPTLFTRTDLRGVVEREIDTLIMAGVCVGSPLSLRAGPAMCHCDHDQLRRIKRPHTETLTLLRRAAEAVGARECWIWNTCSRYEFYAWLPAGTTAAQGRELLVRAAAEVFGPLPPPNANLLMGRDAWRHAVRTAAGMNSSLVGDAEVVEQLRSAKAAANYAGTAGEMTDAFIDGVAHAVRALRDSTAWGRYEHRYCDIAMSRLTPLLPPNLPHKRCLVIGGSTTSCSVLETLSQRFGVPGRQLSLIYRGHRKGALMKRMHAAVGEGPSLTVDDYRDPRVLDAIAEADLVVFAIDQREPVFSAETVAMARHAHRRPFTVVDFNTFGSLHITGPIDGLRFIDASRVDAQVAAFNADMLDDSRLASAVTEADEWIDRHVGAKPAAAGPRSAEGPSC